jgi:hypothetical protein
MRAIAQVPFVWRPMFSLKGWHMDSDKPVFFLGGMGLVILCFLVGSATTALVLWLLSRLC